MTVKLLTEQHLEFLSLKRGDAGSCQNGKLLEILCRGSLIENGILIVMGILHFYAMLKIAHPAYSNLDIAFRSHSKCHKLLALLRKECKCNAMSV